MNESRGLTERRHSIKRISTVLLILPAAIAVLALTLAASPLAAEDGGTKTAVTVWWVVFNQPENCASSPCSVDDLFVPEVEGSAFNATGALVDANRKVRLVTALYETGPDFADIGPFTSLIGGPGLVDLQGAEIHIVVRSHGPAIEGQEDQQITLFLEPGCQDLGGPNECVDIQFAIHQPGMGMMSEVFRFEDDSVVTGASSKLIRGDGFVKLILMTRID